MSKTIDITSKLHEEATIIKFAEGKEFKVNDNYKTVLEVTALFEDEETLTNQEAIERMVKAVGLLMGKEAEKECGNFSIKQLKTVFTAAMQVVSGNNEDARFQE